MKVYLLTIECLYQWSYLYPRASKNKNQPSVFSQAVDHLASYRITPMERVGLQLFNNPLADISQFTDKSQSRQPPSSTLVTPKSTPVDIIDPSMKEEVHAGLRKMRQNAVAFMEALNKDEQLSVEDAEDLFNRTISLYSTLKSTFGVVSSSLDSNFEQERKAILNERHFINNSHVMFARYKKGEMTLQQFRHGVGILHTNYMKHINSEVLEQSPPEIFETESTNLAPQQLAFAQGNFFHSPGNQKSKEEELSHSKDFFDFKNDVQSGTKGKQDHNIFTSFGFPQIAQNNARVNIVSDPNMEVNQPVQVESPPNVGSPNDDRHTKGPDYKPAIELKKVRSSNQLSKIEESNSADNEAAFHRPVDMGALMGDATLSLPIEIRGSVGRMAAARMNLNSSHPEFETSGMGVRNSLQSSQHHSRMNQSHQSGKQTSNVKIGSKKSPRSSEVKVDDPYTHEKIEWFDPVPDFAKIIEPNSSQLKEKPSDGSKFNAEEFFSVRSMGDRKTSFGQDMIAGNSVWENSQVNTPDKVTDDHHALSSKKFQFSDNCIKRPQLETIRESPKTPMEQETPRQIMPIIFPVDTTPQSQQAHSKLPQIESNFVRYSDSPTAAQNEQQATTSVIDDSTFGLMNKMRLPSVTPSPDTSHLMSKISRLESFLVEKDLQLSIEKRERAEEVESLNITLAKLTQDNIDMKKKSSNFSTIDANLHDQLSTLIREKAVLSADIKRKDMEINTLKQQVEALFYESTEKINSQNNLIEQLASKQQELLKENRQLSTANSRLGLNAHSNAGTHDLVSKLEDQVISLKGELTAAQIELNQCKANSSGIEHLGKDQEAFYKACQEQVEKIRANFERTIKQISEAHDRETIQTTEAHRSEVRRLTQKAKDLEKQIMNQTIMSISKINLTPASPSIRLNGSDSNGGRGLHFTDPVHQHGQAQIDRLEAELLQAKQDLIRKEVDLGYLKDDVARKDDQLDAAQSLIDKQTKELSASKEASLEQLHTYYAKEKALQESNRKFGELMKKYTELLKSLETREHESAMLRKELNEYHSRLMRITDKHAAEIESVVKGTHHDSEMVKLREINELNDRKIGELVATNLQLKQRMIELETDLELQLKTVEADRESKRNVESENHKIKEIMFLQKKKILGLEEKILECDLAVGQAARLRQEISLYKLLLKEILPRLDDLGMGSLSKDVESLINAPFPVFTPPSQKQQLSQEEESMIKTGIAQINLKHLNPSKLNLSGQNSLHNSVHKDSHFPIESSINHQSNQAYESVWKSQHSLAASLHDTKFEVRADSRPESPQKSQQIKTLGKTVSFSVQDQEPLPQIAKVEVAEIKPTVKENRIRDYREVLESMVATESDRETIRDACLNRSGLFFQNEFINFFLEGINRDPKSGDTTVHTRLVVAEPITLLELGLQNHGKKNLL